MLKIPISRTILITITNPGKHGRSLVGVLRDPKREDAVCGSTFKAKNETKSKVLLKDKK